MTANPQSGSTMQKRGERLTSRMERIGFNPTDFNGRNYQLFAPLLGGAHHELSDDGLREQLQAVLNGHVASVGIRAQRSDGKIL